MTDRKVTVNEADVGRSLGVVRRWDRLVTGWRGPRATGGQGEGRRYPFDYMPSALDIAHWFKDEVLGKRFENRGGAGTGLYWDPETNEHCALWLLATVDHDDQMFWLLEIDTNDSQDLLLVTFGLMESLGCEWRNEPSAPHRKADGLIWFANRIEAINEDWNQASEKEK